MMFKGTDNDDDDFSTTQHSTVIEGWSGYSQSLSGSGGVVWRCVSP